MSRRSTRKQTFIFTGLGASLLIAVFLSPFASSDPDGLDRVSQDHGFDTKASEAPPAHKLPFYHLFNEYTLRGVPAGMGTPLAGLVGTLATFGLAWGVGKVATRRSNSDSLE